MRVTASLLLLAALTLSAKPTFCQDTSTDEQGINPNATYHGSEIDSVNVGTRRLVLHIPLLTDHSQRGQLNFTYSLSYTSTGQWWDRTAGGFQSWQPPPRYGISDVHIITDGALSSGPSFRYKDDITGKVYTESTIQEADGQLHTLGDSGRTIDGSGILSSVGFVTDNHGLQYSDGMKIEDPNGNEMTTTYQTVGSITSTIMTDTLGRTWVTTPGITDLSGCPVPAVSATTWAVPGTNGGTRIFKLCYSNVTIQTKFGFPNIAEYNGTAKMVTGVVLPNLKTWRFDHDTYGNISKVYLPEGGTISYAWSGTNGCGSALGMRTVASRTVFDGVNTYTWNYNGSTVTDPLGNDTVYAASCEGVVTSIKNFQGSAAGGTLVRTITKSYQTLDDPYIKDLFQSGIDPPKLLLSTTTTWANGQVAQQQLSYDAGFTFTDLNNRSQHHSVYGMVIQKTDYDFGSSAPGPQLATTNTTYLALSSPAYLSANLLDLKSSVVVLNPSGYKCAETDYTYDDANRLFSSGVTQQLVAAPDSVRGNLTSVSQQLSATPCQASASWTPLTSYRNVYDTGETYQSIDPLGHTVTYAYSPSYYGAYPSTITNALNRSTSNVFDFNTGLLISTTDPNSLTNSYTYDNMLRLLQANHPDGGQTTVSYQESSFPFTTTVTHKIDSAEAKTETSAFDRLGRLTQGQLASDPHGPVLTETTYDALGRVASVSNPHRSGSDPSSSPGVTTYIYDALGRKCVEVPPDGTAVPSNTCPTSAPAKDIFTSYSGNTTTVTDPAGKKRQSTTDALGRLTQVVEDPGGLGYITNYSYDTLGNLTSVVQNGSHQRSFTYDSLSRLLTSTNPETGAICYGTVSAGQCQNNGYDADGNLVAKTDARGITTTYSYDALNREISRTYSNGDPTITTHYDEANCLSLPQCANIGHRTSMTDAAGSESWSFDVVDRMHRDQRATNGITKTTTYNFDLAGNITSVTYPTGRVVNYTYDAANRPATAADGSNGITYATGMQSPPSGCPSTAACYTPQGSFYALSIGQSSTFTGLNLTHHYNNRLQPLEFQASSTGGNAIDVSYSFVDPVSLGNAGHVFSIANNLNASRSQSFSYDQLNRITNAGTTATTGTYCWGYQFGYDAWGNLLYQQGWAPNYNGCSEPTMSPVTADGNNHISAFGYDASGNATGDGAFAYTWDAESQMKTAAGVTYTYDGDGRRVIKSNGKIYWYGSGGEILAETDAAGNTLNEYIFFGGQRIAMLPSGASPLFYVEDFLGTSRVITSNTGVVCYDADFDPFGGEHAYTNTCPQNYKFEGKERDTETGNDDFGARYYSNRYGRWLSADWSAVPVPVPYANLTNPQTLNLYSMVSDDPESFADLDGHCPRGTQWLCNAGQRVYNGVRGKGFKTNAQLLPKGTVKTVTVDSHPVGLTMQQFNQALNATIAVMTLGALEGANGGGGDDDDPIEDLAPSADAAAEDGGDTPAINWGQQQKHFEGHNDFLPGRSTLTANPEELAKSAGSGTPVNNVPRGQPGFKERVDFGKVIGNYVDPRSGASAPTTKGIISYSKNGIHVVPARP